MVATGRVQPISDTNERKSTIFAPCGYDGGNGSIKFVSSISEVLIPSYFLPLYSELIELPDTERGGLLEYLDGESETLKGERWYFGEAASIQSPLGYTKVTDRKGGKIYYGLRLFLGIVALAYPNAERVNLEVMASIQDAPTYRTHLAKTLSGVHVVRFNNGQPQTITVRVKQVWDEGVGCGFYLRQTHQTPPKSTIGLVDFGNGTTIVSLLSGGKVVNRRVFDIGIDDLIEAIATSEETRRVLGVDGRNHLVREALERSDFVYGKGRKAWNISEIYKREMVRWLNGTLVPVVKHLDSWDIDKAFAVGGGAHLKGFDLILGKHDIESTPDPLWSNARGLFGLAQLSQRVNQP